MKNQSFLARGLATALATTLSFGLASSLHAQPVAKPATPSGNAAAVARIALPATFAGVLPCANCAGIAHTLTLRADGSYRLRRTYLGKPDGPFAETGRWTLDAQGQRLALSDGQDTQFFALQGPDTLRALDRSGQPFTSSANLDLRRTAQIDPVNDPLRLRGEFRYMADAATFTDCASGQRWPVAMVGDYLALERQYTQRRSASNAAGAPLPLLVHLQGRIMEMPAMEGPAREHLVVDQFGSAQPGSSCGAAAPGAAPSPATATLQNTYWKLVELGGQAVAMLPEQEREVRITLGLDGARLVGFSGCNQLMGAYVQDGAALQFTQLAGTRMACPQPVAELESQVLAMLAATTGQRIEGEQLSLLGGAQVLARFEAVYLR